MVGASDKGSTDVMFDISNGTRANTLGFLPQLLRSPDLTFLMEAYDALSAAIAQRAGFANEAS